MSGIAQYSNGRFRLAAADFERSLDLLRDASLGMGYERVGNRMFFIRTLAFLGQFVRLREVQQAGLQDALAPGDMYAAVHMRIGFASLAWLSDDQPDVARLQIAEALKLWTTRAYHLEHYYALLARVWLKLYVGDAVRAHEVASELVARSRRSLIWRVQTLRLHTLYAQGSVALGLIERSAPQARALTEAVLRDAKSIERERMTWMVPFARVLRAGVRCAVGHAPRRASSWRELRQSSRGGTSPAMPRRHGRERRASATTQRARCKRRTPWQSCEGWDWSLPSVSWPCCSRVFTVMFVDKLASPEAARVSRILATRRPRAMPEIERCRVSGSRGGCLPSELVAQTPNIRDAELLDD